MRHIYLSLIALALITTEPAGAWKPVFAGHRGSYKGVMNTAEAYRNGVDHYGYSGLECDVRVTKDGAYVISHDETTNACGGSLTVANATLAELKAEKYSQTRGGVTYTGEICTVDEYLSICEEKNAFPIIELKWAVGINNNDMHNFPGLYALIEKHNMVDKAQILTSMQASIEYVRTNYPKLHCQYLCYSITDARLDWCKKWKVNPSVQNGGLTLQDVKRCKDAGLEVAAWTINNEADYIKHGNMGCYMMTCDYLYPSKMPELEDIDWDNVLVPTHPLDTVYVTPLFNHTMSGNSLPSDFPTTSSGLYQQAQEAAYIDGLFYVSDFQAGKVIAIDTAAQVTDLGWSTPRHGICRDDAGNLIMNISATASQPETLAMRSHDGQSTDTVTIELNHPGQTNFPTASGDIYSPAGGYVYFFPNGQNYVDIVSIKSGKYVETTSVSVSLTGSTAGYVIPIDNNPSWFIYQVRSNGYYLYKNTDKGGYVNTSSTTTAPGRNSSVGGAFFQLGGHECFVHGSGSNYNGGWTLRDMSSTDHTALYSQAPLGSGGYSANASVGAFFHWERIDSITVNLYEYCLGAGIAGWEISTQPHIIRSTGLTLSAKDTTIVIGESVTLTATVYPADATNRNVHFKATPARTAGLQSNGLSATMTPTMLGDFTLTATLDDWKAECTVHVVESTDIEEVSYKSGTSEKMVIDGRIVIRKGDRIIDMLGSEIR